MPRNITVTFSDGSKHIYQNAPDNVTPEAIKTRAESEFKKTVTALDGGRKPQTRTALESAGIGIRDIATGLGGMADIVAAPVNTVANAVAGYQRARRVCERAAAYAASNSSRRAASRRWSAATMSSGVDASST